MSLAHISEKPWGDITEADYTLEQWHAACLIHLHDGAPTSKSQCKLPVRTPGGALNRNGVHAAAAALAGARAPIKAPQDQIDKAARALRGFYNQLGETPPPSLMTHAESFVDDILEHHGIKGMKWGVHRDRSSSVSVSDRRKKLKTSGGHGLPAHPDAVRAREIGQRGKGSGLKTLSNQELRDYANRLQLEQNVKRLNFNERSAPVRFIGSLLGRQGNQLANEAAKSGAKHAGKKALTLALAAA